jgi:hypothetical protein
MDVLLMPLMAMGLVFIIAPYLALIPSIIFFYFYFKSKRWVVLIAGILWIVYSVYETGMMLRMLCTGECNIRIDLLLIYPLLIFVSISALVSVFRSRKKIKNV